MRITMPTKYSTNTSKGDKKAPSPNTAYTVYFVHQNFSYAKTSYMQGTLYAIVSKRLVKGRVNN